MHNTGMQAYIKYFDYTGLFISPWNILKIRNK